MKKILVFTSCEGHLSIAQAVKESLKKNSLNISTANLFPRGAFAVYRPFYRYLPSLFKYPFKISQQKTVVKGSTVLFEKWLIKKTKEEIKKKQPDLIVSTHYLYNPAINKTLDSQRSQIPFINIITDTWVTHKMIFDKKSHKNLVYDQKTLKLGLKEKVERNRLSVTGWFIRKGFYQKYNLDKIKKELGFKKDVLTLLICGGSEGTNMILKIVPALFTSKKPLQVMVVCGSNDNLYKTLVSLKKLLPRIAKVSSSLKNKYIFKTKNLHLKLFKFTDQLPQLMAISDLVIGKAGPNLLFESVAARKPFMAICHISGQEDGNLDIIRKKGLGFVEESPVKSIKLLQKIINDPKVLDKFKKHIEKERKYNLRAGKKLIKIVENLT